MRYVLSYREPLTGRRIELAPTLAYPHAAVSELAARGIRATVHVRARSQVGAP